MSHGGDLSGVEELEQHPDVEGGIVGEDDDGILPEVSVGVGGQDVVKEGGVRGENGPMGSESVLSRIVRNIRIV